MQLNVIWSFGTYVGSWSCLSYVVEFRLRIIFRMKSCLPVSVEKALGICVPPLIDHPGASQACPANTGARGSSAGENALIMTNVPFVNAECHSLQRNSSILWRPGSLQLAADL